MTEDLSVVVRRLSLAREVEEFFYHEAELLDQRRYEEWLDLFTDDTHYFMPMRRNVKFDQTAREKTTGVGDMSWFDEGKETLEPAGPSDTHRHPLGRGTPVPCLPLRLQRLRASRGRRRGDHQ